MKARLSISDTTDDTTLGLVLAGVCRAIDSHCGQRFWRDAVATTRYYTAEHDDDFVHRPARERDQPCHRPSDDGRIRHDLGRNGLRPYALNAAADGLALHLARDGTQWAITLCQPRRGVKIVGIFGWPAVPDAIAEAALLWSERLYKRKDAPFGVLAFPEAGEMRLLEKMDPDVVTLLKPYVRLH
ncbi:MAG: hypothetical protein IPL70_13285 [Uliginosibacterium sp.]|nr:hypothetical protein [Uliginosibacterium sp.]